MKHYTIQGINGYWFERISKKQARIAYKNGLSVVMCPVNLKPFTMWNCEAVVNRRWREQFVIDEIGVKNDFNNLVNSFEYYNCTSSETGRYTAFYIPVVDVDRYTGEKPTAETLETVKQYDYRFLEV